MCFGFMKLWCSNWLGPQLFLAYRRWQHARTVVEAMHHLMFLYLLWNSHNRSCIQTACCETCYIIFNFIWKYMKTPSKGCTGGERLSHFSTECTGCSVNSCTFLPTCWSQSKKTIIWFNSTAPILYKHGSNYK